LTAVAEEALAEKIGPIGGQYGDSDRAGFVLHMLDEFIHHGAEVALLRDLYRAQHGEPERDPLVRALLAGDASTVGERTADDPSALDRVRASHPRPGSGLRRRHSSDASLTR
jgi:hypothetical protein